MTLLLLTEKNRKTYLPQILEIEANARYPLGDDFFVIDHGNNYFEFFNRLGKCRYYAWLEAKRVVGVVAAVLRRVPMGPNNQLTSAWYLCDLKIHPDYRGRKISLRFFSHIFFRNYLRCMRGYAISMNAADCSENRIARLGKKFYWASTHITALSLWSLNASEMIDVQPMLERHRGPVSYLSLRGVKDIVLESTQQPLPILHTQFGQMGDPKASLECNVGSKHMFCAPTQDFLTLELCALGLMPSSSATIISHRMQHNDWRWVLTSDI